MRHRTRALLLLTGLAVALVLATATGDGYQRMSRDYVHYEGVGLGYDSMRVVVGGWPWPYLEDKPYAFSPAGSVGFVQGLLGLDDFRTASFLADVAFFLAVVLLPGVALRHARRLTQPQKTP